MQVRKKVVKVITNSLLNLGDTLQAEKSGLNSPNGTAAPSKPSSAVEFRNGVNSNGEKVDLTWIHEIFQGTLTNETKCLNCETVSSKDEDFLDLSVDIDQHTSLSACLRGFSSTETLSSEQKYFCETCCAKQEATKCMRLKKLPKILAIHLKRFKYVDQLSRYTKLSYRVVFPSR